jgi:hypothetical protein
MSQENVAVVRGLLAHGATRFALLLSLLPFGALGAVACDDDESATAETEVIDFGQDPSGGGPVAVAGGPEPAATTGRGLAQSASASRSSKVSFAVARRGAY